MLRTGVRLAVVLGLLATGAACSGGEGSRDGGKVQLTPLSLLFQKYYVRGVVLSGLK